MPELYFNGSNCTQYATLYSKGVGVRIADSGNLAILAPRESVPLRPKRKAKLLACLTNPKPDEWTGDRGMYLSLHIEVLQSS